MLDFKGFFSSKTVWVNLLIALAGLLILLALIPLDRQIIGIGLIAGGLLGAEFRRRATSRIGNAVNNLVDRRRR